MRLLRLTVLAHLAVVLVACGGGGGGGGGTDGGTIENPAYPASGSYAWITKATGIEGSQKTGVSLVHSSRPDTEYVVEAPGSGGALTDVRLLTLGTVDGGQTRSTGHQAHTLVYIVGGDVRTLPLQANGSSPQSQVQRSQTASGCRFLIAAADHAAPLNSRFIVSTSGSDGQCGTADDGRAELKLGSGGAPQLTVLSGDAPLGALRHPQTMAPVAWVYPRDLLLWADPSRPVAIRPASSRALSGLLAAAPDAALVTDGTRLSLLGFTGSAVTETALGDSVAGGSAWQLAGFDRDNFYAYEPGASLSGTWKLVKVTRSNPRALLLATGTGRIELASMGRDMLYATILAGSENRLLRVDKAGGTPVVKADLTTTLTTVVTGASNVHQRVRISGLGGGTVQYVVEMVDETDLVLLAVPGGLPMSLVDATSFNYNASESRSHFLVAGNFGAQSFADATLTGYDSAARTATTLGRLPGRVEYGSDGVFAQVNSPPGSMGLGYAARATAAGVQSAGSRVFSFQLGVANSLQYTSRTQ